LRIAWLFSFPNLFNSRFSRRKIDNKDSTSYKCPNRDRDVNITLVEEV
jgi:hypothetical protein